MFQAVQKYNKICFSKWIVLIVLSFLSSLMLTQGAYAETDKAPAKEKESSKFIIINMILSTENQGHHVTIAPKIKVKDDSEAIIQMDGSDLQSVDKKSSTVSKNFEQVRNSKSKPFISSISILPQIIPGTHPKRIKIKIELSVKNYNQIHTQKIITTVTDGESTELRWVSPDKKETNSFTVVASIAKKK